MDELCRMLVLRRRGTKARLQQDLHLFTHQRSIDELSDGSAGIDRREQAGLIAFLKEFLPQVFDFVE